MSKLHERTKEAERRLFEAMKKALHVDLSDATAFHDYDKSYREAMDGLKFSASYLAAVSPGNAMLPAAGSRIDAEKHTAGSVTWKILVDEADLVMGEAVGLVRRS